MAEENGYDDGDGKKIFLTNHKIPSNQVLEDLERGTSKQYKTIPNCEPLIVRIEASDQGNRVSNFWSVSSSHSLSEKKI